MKFQKITVPVPVGKYPLSRAQSTRESETYAPANNLATRDDTVFSPPVVEDGNQANGDGTFVSRSSDCELEHSQLIQAGLSTLFPLVFSPVPVSLKVFAAVSIPVEVERGAPRRGPADEISGEEEQRRRSIFGIPLYASFEAHQERHQSGVSLRHARQPFSPSACSNAPS